MSLFPLVSQCYTVSSAIDWLKIYKFTQLQTIMFTPKKHAVTINTLKFLAIHVSVIDRYSLHTDTNTNNN